MILKTLYGFTNGGVRLRTQRRKYNYSFGVTWQQAELEGKIISGTKGFNHLQNIQEPFTQCKFQI